MAIVIATFGYAEDRSYTVNIKIEYSNTASTNNKGQTFTVYNISKLLPNIPIVGYLDGQRVASQGGLEVVFPLDCAPPGQSSFNYSLQFCGDNIQDIDLSVILTGTTDGPCGKATAKRNFSKDIVINDLQLGATKILFKNLQNRLTCIITATLVADPCPLIPLKNDYYVCESDLRDVYDSEPSSLNTIAIPTGTPAHAYNAQYYTAIEPILFSNNIGGESSANYMYYLSQYNHWYYYDESMLQWKLFNVGAATMPLYKTTNTDANFLAFRYALFSLNNSNQSDDNTRFLEVKLVAQTNIGCTVEKLFNVHLNEVPIIELGEPALKCNNEIVSLDAGDGFVSYTWTKTGLSEPVSCSKTYDATSKGEYLVEAYTDAGCKEYDGKILMGSNIAVSISASDIYVFPLNYVPAQDPVTLTAVPSAVATYLWTLPDGTTENTSVIITRQHGKFVLEATDVNGCKAYAEIILLDATKVNNIAETHNKIAAFKIKDIFMDNMSEVILIVDDDARVDNGAYDLENDILNYSYQVRLHYGHNDVKPSAWELTVPYVLNIEGMGNTMADNVVVRDNMVQGQVLMDGDKYQANSIIFSGAQLVIQKNNILLNGITISNANDIPDDIYIELVQNVFFIPYMSHDASVPSLSLQSTINHDDHKITLSWEALSEAYEYELELTYLDKYSNNYNIQDLDMLFKDRSWNIITPYTSYTFDATFPEGRLYYRIRPVGKIVIDTKDYTHIMYGAWTMGTNIEIQQGGGGSSSSSNDFMEPFQSDMSWTKIVSFAEEGKKKEVIGFADKLMRSKQTLTSLNSDNITLATETYYDYESRPVLNVLLAPIMDPAANNLIYKSGLNKINKNGITTDLGIEDYTQNIQPQLATTSGAANYYSANNPLLSTNNNKFANISLIPNANGYVTTLVQYTRDNTGRVKAQSGIGEQFKIHTENTPKHFTKYYYTTPNKKELSRLFGENIGDASCYTKEITIDPNGQASVAYKNLSAKVVATALMGATPDNVTPLTSNGNQMLEYSLPNTNNERLEVEHKFVNLGTPQDYYFDYKISVKNDGNNITITMPDGTTKSIPNCMQCTYNLEIGITDPNGASVPLQQYTGGSSPQYVAVNHPDYDVAKGKIVKNLFNSLTPPCANQQISIQDINLHFAARFTEEGEYYLFKKLVLNTESVSAMAQNIDSNPQITSEISNFINQYDLNNICPDDANYCHVECIKTINSNFYSQLSAYMGDLSPYNTMLPFSPTIANFNQTYINNIIPITPLTTTAPDRATLITDILAFYEDYIASCLGDVIDGLQEAVDAECMGLEGNMKTQVSPDGFYFMTNTATYNFVDKFKETFFVRNTNGSYTAYATGLQNVINAIHATNNSVATSFNADVNAVRTILTDNWKEEYADELVKHHREYPHLPYCEEEKDAGKYGFMLSSAESFAQAKAKGYLNSSNQINIDNDPITDLNEQTLKTAFEKYNLTVVQGTASSIIPTNQRLDYLLNPSNNYSFTITDNSGTGFVVNIRELFYKKFVLLNTTDWDINSNAELADNYWQMLLGMYGFLRSEQLEQRRKNLGVNYYNDDYALVRSVHYQGGDDAIAGNTDPAEAWDDFMAPVCTDYATQFIYSLRSECSDCAIPDIGTPAYENLLEGLTDLCNGNIGNANPYGWYLHLTSQQLTTLGLTAACGICANVILDSEPKYQYGTTSSLLPDDQCLDWALNTYMTRINESRIIDKDHTLLTEIVNLNISPGGAYSHKNPPLATSIITINNANSSSNPNTCIYNPSLKIGYNVDGASNQFLSSGLYIQNTSNLVNNCNCRRKILLIDHNAVEKCQAHVINLNIVRFITDASNQFVIIDDVDGPDNPRFGVPEFINTTKITPMNKKVLVRFVRPGINNTNPTLVEDYLYLYILDDYNSGSTVIGSPQGDSYNPICSDNTLYSSSYCATGTAFLNNNITQYCLDANGNPTTTKCVSQSIEHIGGSKLKIKLNKNSLASASFSNPNFSFPLNNVPANTSIHFNMNLSYLTGLTSMSYTIPSVAYTNYVNNLNSYINKLNNLRFVVSTDPNLSISQSQLYNESMSLFLPSNLSDVIAPGYIVPSGCHVDNVITVANSLLNAPINFVNSFPNEQTINYEFSFNSGNYSAPLYFGILGDFPYNNVNYDYVLNVNYLYVNYDRTYTAAENAENASCRNFNPFYKISYDIGGVQLPDYGNIDPPTCSELNTEAKTDIVEDYRQSIYNAILVQTATAYKQVCMPPTETFTYRTTANEYHYTLYYYDRAGNLIQTIPPEGVTPIAEDDFYEDGTLHSGIAPSHTLPTQYNYNTRNQIIEQRTPDAGKTVFYYDNKAQLLFSQNAKQAGSAISYTEYDALGRIVEVGQASTPALLIYNQKPQVQQGNKTQVTRTWYDNPPPDVNVLEFEQSNLRNRVATTAYYPLSLSGTANAIAYNYDETGNVKQVLQITDASQVHEWLPDFPSSIYTTTDYNYDLISGKVNNIKFEDHTFQWTSDDIDAAFRAGYPDIRSFEQKYHYDADNRITHAYSRYGDNTQWMQEARYFYYPHGALARVEYGHDKVQAQDYAYNLQGWLKGTDIAFLAANVPDNMLNSYFPKPEAAFALQYYQGDYTPILSGTTTTDPISAASFGSWYNKGHGNGMYNGNIAAMNTYIAHFDQNNHQSHIFEYKYDQLNRIVNNKGYMFDRQNNSYDLSHYAENYTYDANGNITSLLRKGAGNFNNTITIDNLSYHYHKNSSNNNLLNNQLAYVTDPEPDNIMPDDIDNQDAGNYEYDAIGQLSKDLSKNLNIDWNVYGKVTNTYSSNTGYTAYNYDASGNRTLKIFSFLNEQTNTLKASIDFYFRDALGNTLAVGNSQYDVLYVSGPTTTTTCKATESSTEYYMYGSSRLGTMRTMHPIASNGDYEVTQVPEVATGYRAYELSNHLGNVLTCVSDVRYHEIYGTATTWKALTLSAQDYYPFGMIMPKRQYNTNGTVTLTNDANATASTTAQIDEYYPDDNTTTIWDAAGDYTLTADPTGLLIDNHESGGQANGIYFNLYDNAQLITTESGDKIEFTLDVANLLQDPECQQQLYLLIKSPLATVGDEQSVYIGDLVAGTHTYTYTANGYNIHGLAIINRMSCGVEVPATSFTLRQCSIAKTHYSYPPAPTIADLNIAPQIPAADITTTVGVTYDDNTHTLTLVGGASPTIQGMTIHIPNLQVGKYYNLKITTGEITIDHAQDESGIGFAIDKDMDADNGYTYAAQGLQANAPNSYNFLALSSDIYITIGGYLIPDDEDNNTLPLAEINIAALQLTAPTNLSTVSIPYSYRYGFNGQEREPSINDGIFSAEYWFYDGRLGRRWNVDPVDQISMSNYSVLGNCPIWFNDVKGDNYVLIDKDGNELKNIESKKYTQDQYFYMTDQKQKNNWIWKSCYQEENGDESCDKYNCIKLNSKESITGDPRENERAVQAGNLPGFNGIYNNEFNYDNQQNILDVSTQNVGNYFEIIKESARGDLDYKKYFNAGELINLDGIYYNDHEALNFLWGKAMQQLDVDIFVALHSAEAFNSVDRIIGESPPANQAAHVKAIIRGYLNHKYDMCSVTEEIEIEVELIYNAYCSNTTFDR